MQQNLVYGCEEERDAAYIKQMAAQITAPTLIMWGKNDKVRTPANSDTNSHGVGVSIPANSDTNSHGVGVSIPANSEMISHGVGMSIHVNYRRFSNSGSHKLHCKLFKR